MFCSFHVTLFNFLLINKGLHLFIWHWTYQSRVAGMFPSHAHPCQESLETWHLAHSPLCPASSYPVSGGPRSLCRRGRRALRWGGREPCCGRQQAGGQATTAGLAVASVSKLVLGRGRSSHLLLKDLCHRLQRKRENFLQKLWKRGVYGNRVCKDSSWVKSSD